MGKEIEKTMPVHLNKKTHKEVKKFGVNQGKTIQEIVNNAIIDYLKMMGHKF
jgi:hypothetical protein